MRGAKGSGLIHLFPMLCKVKAEMLSSEDLVMVTKVQNFRQILVAVLVVYLTILDL